MAKKPTIVAFAGSTRVESYNKKLIKIAAQAAKDAGAEVKLIDLRDLPMPLYDGDLEAGSGIPKNAKTFKELLKAADGFIIASPEYNSSVSAVLKNAIDWASRPEPGEPWLVAFKDKTAAIMSASIGALGGLRGLVHLRSLLGNIGVLLLPDQVAVGLAESAFGADGSLVDKNQTESVQGVARKLVLTLAKLTA